MDTGSAELVMTLELGTLLGQHCLAGSRSNLVLHRSHQVLLL